EQQQSSVKVWTPPPEPPEEKPAPALPVEAAKTPPAPESTNPFDGAKLYVNPDYAKRLDDAAAATPALAPAIKKLGKQPTALWLESLGALQHLPRWLDDAESQQKTAKQPVVPVFLIYNLPNRDCAAKSSSGELTLENDGEKRYRTEFIDKIAEQFKARP